jgi:hypothetical protein
MSTNTKPMELRPSEIELTADELESVSGGVGSGCGTIMFLPPESPPISPGLADAIGKMVAAAAHF